MRGTGGTYLRGNVYWIRYRHRGQLFRESSESESETVARRLLKKRIGETGKRGAKFLGPTEERLKFDDIAKMLTDDYAANERKSAKRIEQAVEHLRGAFGLDRAVDITTDRVQGYIADRRKAGAANATINRELAALKRMFRIAVNAERLSRAPHISMLEENNARQGFLDHGQWLALRDALPDHLRGPISFLYLSGWRVSEMKALEWRDIDVAGKVIRLRPELSKNKRGRVLPLSGELADVIERASDARRLDCPFVFHVAGRPLVDFRGSWSAACKAAGLRGLLIHDLRRTAVRNMVRAGIPERIAMELSGHKTRAVFDRYDIVNEADLMDAVARRDDYLAAQPTQPRIVTIPRPQKA